MELYLANKLTKKAILEQVQVARYISAPIALNVVLRDQVILHPFRKDEMGYFSCEVNRQSFENLKNVLYPYKSALRFS